MPEWTPVARCEVKGYREAERTGQEPVPCPERFVTIVPVMGTGVFMCEAHAKGSMKEAE